MEEKSASDLKDVIRSRIPVVFCFFGFFSFQGELALAVPAPPLEWISSPPIVVAVLITTKCNESPGSSRMGVILRWLFFPSEAVQDKPHSP